MLEIVATVLSILGSTLYLAHRFSRVELRVEDHERRLETLEGRRSRAKV